MTTGTIAICTRDRVELLRGCLASLEHQLAEPGQLEVLVVDNGSGDGTAELLEGWERDGPDRRVVHEPVVGLSHARNRALAVSTRDVVLFTDDDALVTPCWGAAHLAAYDDPQVGSAGGPVGLVWPQGRPAWMADELTQWYGALDLGDESGPYPNPHGPYGVNMSVRRTAALAAGGYDTRLGRIGRVLLSGEEPDLHRRLLGAGMGSVYVPAAGLVHRVIAERADRRWLLRRGWAQGVTNTRLTVFGERPSRRAMVRHGTGELGDAATRWWRRRSGADDQDELAALVLVAAHAAAGFEALRLAAVGRREGPR